MDDMRALGLPLALLLLLVVPAAAAPDAGDLLRHLRGGDASRRLEALRRLSAEGSLAEGIPPERLHRALRDLLDWKASAEGRGLAGRLLGRRGDAKDRIAVVERLRREADDRAHPGLLAGLDGCADEAVLDAIHAALGDEEDERVRGLLVLALGRCRGDRALRTLHRLASRRRPWSVVTSALIALGDRRRTDVVALLVRKLRSRDPGIRAMAIESLVRLTGLRLGAETEAWETWWDEVKEDFRFPDPDRDALGPGGRPYAAGRRVVARYYGIPVRGRRVAFCFDLSASMWGPAIEAAIEELTAAVKALPTGTRFSVVFFNEKVWRWREAPSPAMPWAKVELFRHLETLTTKSYTNIHDALESALGLAGRGRHAVAPAPGSTRCSSSRTASPTAVATRDTRAIARSILRLNTPRAARIHCIALGEKPRALLKRLAEENGGVFVDAKALKKR
jgi:hypothetical protein